MIRVPNRKIPMSMVFDWLAAAADALHLRHVLAENPLFEYGLYFDEFAPRHAQVVFVRKPKLAVHASCRDR